MIPHQCLGAVWSREKSRSTDAATVLATISQFNSVSYRVMSTILMPDDLKPHERAKIISIWIDIAQVRICFPIKRPKNYNVEIIVMINVYLWIGVTDT